ncbi:MAG: altronate hydrolase [Opitutae bacterium]|nr:altronate hydrolase [Opitutae bacterium]|tara:strand:+ start:151 stop:1809 length:1659 start_codon:yes stop_codon:yes gene_type:complete
MISKHTAAIRITPEDNLLVALRDLPEGEIIEVNGERIVIGQAISAKHKIAGRDFAQGDLATMYGVVVGKTTAKVSKGHALTTDNLAHSSAAYGEKDEEVEWSPPDASKWMNRSFLGYHRSDGSVGTANYWLFLPMVFCEEGNLVMLREAFTKALGYERRQRYHAFVASLASAHRAGGDEQLLSKIELPDERDYAEDPIFPGLDGVKFLVHGMGCGETRDVSNELCGLLAGYVNHPNVAGATILSLGCQHAQVSILEKEIAKRNPLFDKPLLVYEQHKHESERAMLENAIRDTFLQLRKANELQREPAPLSKLTIGMECGASDGFSGISSNPVLGRVADLIVALGGKVILSEFPELCGVEQELVNRCASPEIGQRFVEIMRNYEARAEEAGSGFHMNPSPGNVKDGLITDAIKSAGAARKGGTSPVVDVLDYPEWVNRPGLSLLCTAGNDVESTTAMAGAGANLQLFSTGLGTPTGNPVSPIVKVSSNTRIAKSFSQYIDFDAGPVISGEQSVNSLGDDLMDAVIEYASGEKTPKSVLSGRDDFLPWKRGISL